MEIIAEGRKIPSWSETKRVGLEMFGIDWPKVIINSYGCRILSNVV